MILAGGYRGILVAAVLLSGGGMAFGQINLTDSTLQTTLNVVQAQSNLNANLHVSSTFGSDSDSASSPISGTMNAAFDLDFSSGNLAIEGFRFNGGTIALANPMAFDISIFFGAFQADITTGSPNQLRGTPSTDGTSMVAPFAKPGTTGLFTAGDHEITLNRGSIKVDSNISSANQDIELSDSNTISGASTSSTKGQVILTQTASDLIANTTTYSLAVVTPIGVEFEDGDSTATFTITGTGSIRAAVTDLIVNFIPWNGVAGDLTQDGQVNSEDITAFVNNWRSTNNTPGRLAIQKGDLNFDGLTDLHDAFLLRSALQGNNLSLNIGDLLAGSTTIPEPSAWMLLTLGCAAMVARRRLAK